MPKLSIEAVQAREAKALFNRLLISGDLGVRHHLTESLPGIPAGTWIFGKIQAKWQDVDGCATFEYEGCSSPPNKRVTKE